MDEQQQPITTPIRQVAAKPNKKLTGFVLIPFGLLLLVVGFQACHKTAKIVSSGHQREPMTANSDDVGAVKDGYAKDAASIEARAKAAKEAMNAADTAVANAAKALDDAQNGKLPPDQADGVPAPTREQQDAMYGHHSANARSGGSGGNSGTGDNQAASIAEQKKQAREARIKAALDSSSVAIDFTANSASPQQVAVTEKPQPVAEQQPERSDTQEASAKLADGKKPVFADFDASEGKLYRVFESNVIETVLTNRVNGALAGPINCMVTTDVYSHDNQVLLIPQGTRIIGAVRAVTDKQTQRLFVAFHRMIMPDGFSVNLDKFIGLNVVGETGLRDIVNHHYASIFGASLAIGAIGAIAQIGNSSGAFTYDPTVAMRNGISEKLGQESEQILQQFLNQIPTFIVRERTRVKVYISSDLELPAYSNHRMAPDL